MLPIGQGPVFLVDEGLDLVYDPVHGFLAHGLESRCPASGNGFVRQIFTQALVAFVSAFNADKNQILAPIIQKFFQTPAFPVGGIAVGEQIVSVKKVHHRVSAHIRIIPPGQIDMQRTVLSFWCVDEVTFYNHGNAPFL